MKIPKRIIKNKRKYIFVKKIKDNMYLYHNIPGGYNICFDNYDLKLIKKQPKMTYAQKHHIR